MDLDIWIGMAASIIIGSVKNPKSKARLKAVMLKIFRTIRNQYAGDADFE